jgi:hypothetical protein
MAWTMTDAARDDDDDDDHFGRAHITWFAAPPLYVLRTTESCPACRTLMHVYTLGCAGYRDRRDPEPTWLFHFLRRIESLPEPVLKRLKAKCGGYFLDREEGSDEIPYLMNHCRCGARLDDDYLHGDVGAAFWPDTPGGYADLKLFLLPIDEPIPIVSSFSIGGDEFLDFDQAGKW